MCGDLLHRVLEPLMPIRARAARRAPAPVCRLLLPAHPRVPDGSELGSPFELEDWEVELFDEALAVDENGHRIYSFVVLVIPRKCGKTAIAALVVLYLALPADGEHRPEVILAAGFLKQTARLWESASAFIVDPKFGSPELPELFLVMANAIKCPSVAGAIERVVGDGDSNHSLDPHAVFADELHVRKTPKQREDWRALTTAQGGRTDPLIPVISTEGDGDDNELALLLERIESDESTERSGARRSLDPLSPRQRARAALARQAA